MENLPFFHDVVLEHIKVALNLSKQEVEDFAADILFALKRGGKIIFFGNGGSATQASHWAEEFVGRFVKKRRSLPAIALGTNFANITGIANDYGFEEVFAREIESLADKKDLAVGISTSGNSPNVVKAIEKAREKGIKTWILTGNGKDNKARKIADKALLINSDKTARVQELHVLVIHMVFDLIDEKYS